MNVQDTNTTQAKALAIIVNWNRRDALDRMLASLEASGPREFDAVLIDNASTDGSVAMAREKYPWLQIVENERNLGGTGGFNCGMRYALNHPAGYEFIWLLDNDVVVHPGAFDGLLNTIRSNDRIGIVGSTILFLDEPDQVQEAGAKINWRTGEIFRNFEGPVSRLPRELIECDYVAACSLLARVEAIRQVGIWDERYFVLWDDVEWGVRFRRAGWRVTATSDSRVEHESYERRRARSSAAGQYQYYRNALYFYSRFTPPPNRLPVLFQQFRMIQALQTNMEQAGRRSEALALRLALRDFFADRMGKPPEMAPAESPASAKTQVQPIPEFRRIALLTRDNPEIARTLHHELSKRFTSAEVDTLLLTNSPEVLRENLPRSRHLPISTLGRRLALAFMLPFQYQATVAPGFQQPFFFETGVAYNIRISDDLSWDVRRRSVADVFKMAGARVSIVFTAFVLTIRAMLKPKAPVNYTDFST